MKVYVVVGNFKNDEDGTDRTWINSVFMDEENAKKRIVKIQELMKQLPKKKDFENVNTDQWNSFRHDYDAVIKLIQSTIDPECYGYMGWDSEFNYIIKERFIEDM